MEISLKILGADTHSVNFFVKHLKKYIALLLLILVVGSVKGALCSQIKGDTITFELALYACHSVPVSCVPSANIGGKQNGGNEPADCNECFDVSFEDILTTGTQRNSNDFDLSPSLDLRFSYLTCPQVSGILDSPPFTDLIIRSDHNLHHSVPSTIIII